jgi:DNA polymerase-3 subunit alpha
MYTSLHGHSESSNVCLLDCISKPKAILDRAHDLGLNGVAITDHEALSSFIKAELYLNAKREEDPTWKNLKFIRGNEIYLVRNGLGKDNYVRGVDRFFHFVLLAKDYTGYLQLCELSSRAWKRSYKHFQVRRPTYYQDIIDVIGANPGHIIGSTACIGGQIGNKFLQVLDGAISIEEAMTYNRAWIERMQEILGVGNVFLEMQPGVTKEQIYCNEKILELSKATNIPYIITTDHHYTKREDRKIHKAYLKSKSGEREVDDFYEATYMMSPEEIHERMDKHLGHDIVAVGLENTNRICERIEEYSLLKPLKIPYLPQKRFDIPLVNGTDLAKEACEKIPNMEKFLNSEEIADKQFAARIIKFLNDSDVLGGSRRLDINEKCERANIELGIIWDAGAKLNVQWSKYFLQVADYIDIYWTDGDSFICPSRGSAGASYICYALGIIQIDPTREGAPLIFERFMNPDRASVLDIDIDVQSNRRGQCINALQAVYGADRVTRVSTFKTEKARSAILTAARALDIDVDIARYISSLIGSERGQQYSLHQTYYGDEENDIKPSKQFQQEMENYPELWEVAQGIEGLISGVGSHAGGVIITEEPITDTCAIMRTSSGDIVTSYDLHEVEAMSLIKIDLLATEGLSKIRTCVDLLCEYDYVQRGKTLKETYENVIGVYNLNRDDHKMWELVWNNEITALFQMEQQSGIQGIALTKPHSLEDLATLNSVIRLMPPDKSAERPLEKFARFRVNHDEWDREMEAYGLTDHERELLHEMFDYSNGISAQQEDLYQLMRCEEIVGYSFGQADKLRKCVAKKNPKDYQAFEEQFWKDVAEKGSSEQLCKYIWNVLVATQRGYSFNLAHTLSYSIVALQEMNLARFYPIIFWNVANLIVDSGAEFQYEVDEDGMLIEKEEDEEEEKDTEEKESGNSTSNYGKIAAAIGRMQKRGVKVLPPDINISNYTYTPNVEENTIRYGLKGIVKVGDSVIEEIMKNRPYTSVEDFLNKVKVNKTQMINLIKCGAFDSFGDREEVMSNYILSISDVKKKLTLQNVATLIEHKLFPDDLSFECRVFNFNKYLRKLKDKKTDYIHLDDIALNFYSQYFDMDKLKALEDGTSVIYAPTWKLIYDSYMLNLKHFIVKNHDELLMSLNQEIISEVFDKYATGTTDKWSMDSVCFYQDNHELEFADLMSLGIEDFWSLPEEPQIANSFKAKDGHIVNMFKLTRIAGTVIDKNKNKSQITLLTTNGVVIVQAYGVMPQYDKQISEVGADGKKHVVEKSWFSRGNKIIINGMRRGENIFVAKKYASQPGHHFMLIKNINEDGSVEIQEERYEVVNAE